MVVTDRTDSVGLYLKEIAKVPLLTPEEEIHLSSLVQASLSVTPDNPNYDNIIKKGKWAKDKMTRANLRLVVYVARGYKYRNLELQDLIQEGSIGLQRAVEKFNTSKKCKFSTYAYWWIRQSITRALQEKSRTIRLPVHVVERLNKAKKASFEITKQTGRIPTTKEIAEFTGISLKELQYLIKMNGCMSLNKLVGKERDTEVSELIESSSPSPETYANEKGLEIDISLALSQLTEKERITIAMRFGLENGYCSSLQEIGDYFDLSKERIRQIQTEALKKLKKSLHWESIKEIFD